MSGHVSPELFSQSFLQGKLNDSVGTELHVCPCASVWLCSVAKSESRERSRGPGLPVHCSVWGSGGWGAALSCVRAPCCPPLLTNSTTGSLPPSGSSVPEGQGELAEPGQLGGNPGPSLPSLPSLPSQEPETWLPFVQLCFSFPAEGRKGIYPVGC